MAITRRLAAPVSLRMATLLRISGVVAVLALGACSADVLTVRGEGDDGAEAGGGGSSAAMGGSTPAVGTSTGGGPPPSTGSSGTIPEGLWGAAAFGEDCGLEVTRGANPDVAPFVWEACEAPFDCTQWPPGPADGGSLHTAEHLVRVVVQSDRVLLGATLVDLNAQPPLLSGVWSVTTGELLIAWRVRDPNCSVAVFPGDDRVWLSLQAFRGNDVEQIHVDHELEGGRFRVLDHDYVGPSIDGNARFYVTSDLAATSVWDALSSRWSTLKPHAYEWDLHAEGLHYLNTEGDDWEEWSAWGWSPGSVPRHLVEPPPGKSVIHVTSNQEHLYWTIGFAEGGSPDTDQTTELWRAPLPVTGLVEGELITTRPFRGVGRASRTRYVALEPYVSSLLHVTDLATRDTTAVPLPPPLAAWRVYYVGADGMNPAGGDGEAAWLSIGGAVVRQPLP